MFLEEAVTPLEACARAGFGQDLWFHAERSSCWGKFSVRNCDPIKDPCWNRLFLKDYTPCWSSSCSPWEGLTFRKFMDDSLLWERPYSREREGFEEEWPVETVMKWLQPIFSTLLYCWWWGSREFQSKVESEKRDGMHGRYCNSCFIFSLWYSDLIVNKLK